MFTTVLKQGNYLIASIQSSLVDSDFLALRDYLMKRVNDDRALGVIVDVTVLDVIDSFAVRTLRNLAHSVQLCGAETVLVGIQPEVALSMVKLGLTLEGIPTLLDLEEGLAFLNEKLGQKI